MSNLAKQLAERARASGEVRETQEFFGVTEKREVSDGIGGTVSIDVPNGKHKVVILSEELGKGKSFNGKDQDELKLTITDNGERKLWNVPQKNEDGTLYYLIDKLESIEIGEPFMVEAVKMKNGKYAKQITKVVAPRFNDTASTGDLPVISLDEDISPEDLPF